MRIFFTQSELPGEQAEEILLPFSNKNPSSDHLQDAWLKYSKIELTVVVTASLVVIEPLLLEIYLPSSSSLFLNADNISPL